MIKNVGTTDKIIRIALALVLVVLNLTGVLAGTIGVVALVAAGVLVGTSLFSFCGLYTLIGVNTCSIEQKNS
ncbi:MAG: DUF2892 domain-containing protein [Bacteroidetes bacterium]|nr:DUF2892 domain-containing protein [Bacteroidota bacterium]MCH8525387.1 DUF2892 domain-containing protein [Balneolales bacterium]